MKLIEQTYVHEDTGIQFNVHAATKQVSVETYHGRKEFIFRNSKSDALIKVGNALKEIGEFVQTL